LAGGWDEREDQSTELLVETLQLQHQVVVELSALQSNYGEWEAKLDDMRCSYKTNAYFHEQTVCNN
jgi:hypothetical protein